MEELGGLGSIREDADQVHSIEPVQPEPTGTETQEVSDIANERQRGKSQQMIDPPNETTINTDTIVLNQCKGKPGRNTGKITVGTKFAQLPRPAPNSVAVRASTPTPQPPHNQKTSGKGTNSTMNLNVSPVPRTRSERASRARSVIDMGTAF
jgi:hypothetical protein